MPPHEHARIKSKLEYFSPGLDSFSHKYRFGTVTGFEQIELQAKLLNYFLGSNKSNINQSDNDPTPGPHTTQKRVEVGTNHGGVGRGETSNPAFRRRGHVHDENRRPKYNYRIPHPSRGHPTNLPHPSPNITTNRTRPHIRHRKQGNQLTCTHWTKEAQAQRDPGIEQLGGMRTSQPADKYIVKRNKIRNQCTLLRNQGEEGVLFYFDKLKEIMSACDKLLFTGRTHGSPLGDRKVKETMYLTISKTVDKLEQWRDNSSTDDTLTSLTLIETSLDEIREMDSAILREEDEAFTEFPSILKLLTKKTRIFGYNPQRVVVRGDVNTTRPLTEKRGEI